MKRYTLILLTLLVLGSAAVSMAKVTEGETTAGPLYTPMYPATEIAYSLAPSFWGDCQYEPTVSLCLECCDQRLQACIQNCGSNVFCQMTCLRQADNCNLSCGF
jgi:hypothetical protein